MAVSTKKDDTCPVSSPLEYRLAGNYGYIALGKFWKFFVQNKTDLLGAADWGALCGHAMRKHVGIFLEGNKPIALQGHGNCSLHHASSPYTWKKSLTSVCLVKYSQRCSSQNRGSKFQICRVPKSKEIDHLKAQYVVWMILS